MNARENEPLEDQEMDAEFVGGPLDGMRITLHVLLREPKLTLLGRTYARQTKSEAEADRRKELDRVT